MEIETYQVDAFTTQAFKGNPAGVCILDTPLPAQLMQQIAEEMSVSETAFLSLDDGGLRWFTPETEVALCGHGTLAVAHVLLQTGRAALGDKLHFHTLSGTLDVSLEPSCIEMNFPVPTLTPIEKNHPYLAALGLKIQDIDAVFEFDSKIMLVVKQSQLVRNLSVDFSSLKALKGRGVLVTAEDETQGFDVISRYFAPWVGINEDPVTGSAHCALAVYWCHQLARTQLTCYQASQRGGELTLTQLDNQRVMLAGNAVTTLKGKLYL